jgi:phage tail-like protein
MATQRPTPYTNFNFLVDLADGLATQPYGGFSEVSGLNMEITVAEYRAGNDAANHVRKVPGVHKSGDVTLKRGVMGTQNLYNWIEKVRTGELDEAKRTVTVTMLSEKRDPVMSWKLLGAMPLKWTGPQLSAKGGTDVAIEEFVLSVEAIEQA